MHIFGWFFIGLFFGLLVRIVTPGRDTGGYFVAAVLGISGSMIGGFIGALFPGPWDAGAWIGSVVGTFVILLCYGLERSLRARQA
jgi:uncharacterized membrane protein YeaQ/YmgE (transglycosylase-associated protein family)